MSNTIVSNIKTIILCGGAGTRMKEETEFKPKPMVLIGGKPMLWHIMKIYSHYKYNEFILALGYKGEMIKDYFLNQRALLNDFTLDVFAHRINFHNNQCDELKITFAETGLESQTGERILRAKKYITEDEFMVTYGDGVSDIDIDRLIDFHRRQGTIGTITGVHPYSKYGLVKIDGKNNLVVDFEQKPLMYDYVSGGFMIFNKKAFDYFDNGPMENGLIKLAKEGQLSIYKHDGFWKSMDTYREMGELNELWQEKRPWAVWEKKS
jgi:glucose-1-phosphate cytidylyltransferase